MRNLAAPGTPGAAVTSGGRAALYRGVVAVAIAAGVMRKSPYIVRGLCRAGFTGGWIAGRC